MSRYIINAENLSKVYRIKQTRGKIIKDLFYPDKKDVPAVKDISFKIKEGESVAFLGPNGAGKTTTTKMLSGLLYPTSGEVSVLGLVPFERKTDFLRQIGLVMGGKAGLNWDLTSNQSFQLTKQIYMIPEKDFIERKGFLLELLDVKDHANTQVRKLSLGQRMKMELIGAMLHNPKVLFLDEPTIGLDIVAKQKVREFLSMIQTDFNTTLLLTSHDMDDIEKVCERVLIIDNGEIILDQSLNVLTERYRKDRFVKFVFNNSTDTSAASQLQLKVTQQGESFIVVEVKKEDMPKLIADISSRFDLLDIDILSVPLEEMISDIFNHSSARAE